MNGLPQVKHSVDVSSFIQYSLDMKLPDFIPSFFLLFRNPNKKLFEKEVARDEALYCDTLSSSNRWCVDCARFLLIAMGKLEGFLLGIKDAAVPL